MRGFLTRGRVLLGLGLVGGGFGGSSPTFKNLGFELAGASPGLAYLWSVTIVAGGQALYDFGASVGLPPNPVETFEAPGWGNAGWLWFFGATPGAEGLTGGVVLGQLATVNFNTGSATAPKENFEVQWTGVDSFSFHLSQTLGVGFSGSGQAGTEDFETGWSVVTFLSTFGLGDTTAGTFGEGVDTERFGDTLVASAAAATDTFAANRAPDNGAPVVFRTPPPYGITAGPTYYVRDAMPGGTTFKVAATLGGAAVDVTLDGTGLVLDVGPRLELADVDWGTFGFLVPGISTVYTEDFEYVAGVFGFVVDPGADVFTSANHPFTNGQAIQFEGPGLPSASTAIAAGITYYARDVVLNVSFKISATFGGSAIDITSTAGTGATVFGDPTLWWNETV